MIIECKNCLKKFTVNDSDIPPTGRTVQCGNCSTQWIQKPITPSITSDENLEIEDADQETAENLEAEDTDQEITENLDVEDTDQETNKNLDFKNKNQDSLADELEASDGKKYKFLPDIDRISKYLNKNPQNIEAKLKAINTTTELEDFILTIINMIGQI